MVSCSSEEPIKIGVVAGLSGRRSQFGVSSRNGVILAVENINKTGGINGRLVELIIKDNQNDVESNTKALKELIQEGAVAIVGPLMSKMAQSSLEATADSDILIISPTISTDEVKDLDDQFLRVMPVSSLESIKIAEATVKGGYRKAAVVYDSSNAAYSVPVYRLYRSTVEQNGIEVVFVHAMGEIEQVKFIKLAKAIIESGADALYMVTSGIDAAFLFQQIRKYNHEIKFFGSGWIRTGNIIEEGGTSVEGLTFVAPFERTVKSKAYLAFEKAYSTNFKTKPGFAAIYSYESAMVLFEVMKNNGSLKPKDIKSAIINKRTFEGLEETFTINKYGDAIRKNQLFSIKNGRFVKEQ